MRLAALALTIVLTLALAACGGCGDAPDTDDDGSCRVEGIVHPAKDCV